MGYNVAIDGPAGAGKSTVAKRVAKEVQQTHIKVDLDPMPSDERRIIHNALTNNKRVYTESEGEEPNRYVVIKSKEDK